MPLNFLNNGYFAAKVGIGTNSPNEKLEVNGAVAIGNATDGIKLRLTGTVGEILGLSTTSGSWNDLDIRTQAATQLYLKTDGNVGIGTASPGAKLEIYGNNATRNTLLNLLTLNGGASASNPYDGFGVGIKFNGRDYSNAVRDYAYIYGVIEDQSSSSTPAGDPGFEGQLRFYTNTGGASATLPTQKMVITAAGNVGIGTTGPFSPLQVGLATFTGANGMHANSRVGISNHGSLTGMMLASTYNDPTYPDYGLVFVHGPSTSDYNVWSISPDGPAKGSGLSFIFKANTTNIHNQTPQVYFEGSTGRVGIGTIIPSEKLDVAGNIKIQAALLSNQENTDVDTGAEVVAQVAYATYTAAFFDFVVKKGTNVRSGTVYACHNGDSTPLVEFTETSTQDLGDTSDVTLSVDISGTNMRLLATVTSDDWSIKSLIRAI